VDDYHRDLCSREPDSPIGKHDIPVCLREHVGECSRLQTDVGRPFLGWARQLSAESAVLSAKLDLRGRIRSNLHSDGRGYVDQTLAILLATADAGRLGCHLVLPVQRRCSVLSFREQRRLRLPHNRSLARPSAWDWMESAVEKKPDDIHRTAHRVFRDSTC